jgi:hypothetical protein
VAAMGAVAAWQGSWLRSGAIESAKVTTAATPSPTPPPAPAMEKGAAPASDANATRAQAESDTQRLRADAEALKRQAEAELARARSEAEFNKAAKARVDADAAALRLRTRAEADAAKIRADAEAAAARTKSDAETAAKATQAQAAKSRDAARVASASAIAGKTAPAAPRDPSRFDGTWNVSIDCPRHTDGTAAFTIELVALVKDGLLRGERGTEGVPNWFRLQGVIEPDGSAKLDAKGLTGDPKYSVGGVRQGSPYTWATVARFEGSRGTGRRTQLRVCDLTFAKR